MRKSVVFTILCVLLTACCTLEVKDNNNKLYLTEPATQESFDIVSHIKARTVLITIQCKDVSLADGKIINDYHLLGWGTGTIMRSLPNGSIIQTAAHVMAVKEENVAGVATICDRFTVVTSSGKEINKVRVIFKSAKDDVAIVAVPGDLGVRSRISRTVSVGQSIHTMGFPYLKGFKSPVITYSRGFISAVGIKKEQTFMGLNNLVRFSIFGYVGSSGSAVWDGAGNIVGMISLQAGFNTFSGMIPQQDSLYGAGCNALIDLYQSIGLTSLSK